MMIQNVMVTLMLTLMLFGSGGTMAAEKRTATLRGGTEISEQGFPAPIATVENKDERRKRSYPMQPPTIPHKIDNYLVNTNSNKCLSCHSRNLSSESGAPMVSVTHFMDRDGNFLASVSPRRYFCSQCHVVQTDSSPHVESDFVDLDDLLRPAATSR